MAPYSLYIKSLLEGTGFAFDDDEQNTGYSDSDDDYLGVGDDDAENDEGMPDIDATHGRGLERKGDNDGPTPVERPTVNEKNRATPAESRERRRMVALRELTSRLVDLGISVYNAYEARGLGKYDSAENTVYRLLELLNMDSPSPEDIVGTLEELGMTMKAAGIDLSGADVGSFTPDMLSEMYFISMPPDKYVFDAAIPDETELNYKARQIDDDIKGMRDGTRIIIPGQPTYRRLGSSVAKKDKTVSSKRNSATGYKGPMNTDTSNANVKHVDHVPPDGSFYFVPHTVFELTKKALSSTVLADSYDLDDLAIDYLFLGQAGFKTKYRAVPSVQLSPAMKAAGVNLGSPCYGSIGLGGEIKFGKNFRDIMLSSELGMCRKGFGGMVKDGKGNPMPQAGNMLYAAVDRAAPKGNTLQVNDKALQDAVIGEYRYYTKTGEFPLFDYFTTNTLTVSSSSGPGTVSVDEEVAEDRGAIAAKQDEYMRYRSDDTDSGNVILQTIDTNFWNRVNDPSSQKVIAELGVPSPDQKADDATNMKRVTAILVGISRVFEDAGAKSRITTYDNVHPIVELDDSEVATTKSITSAWSNALKQSGGKKAALKGIFSGANLYAMVNALLEWTESFSGKFQDTLGDTLQNLTIAGVFDEAVDDITPDIDIDLVIGQYMEDGGSSNTEDDVTVAKYTLYYVLQRGREIMCPFLENVHDMMQLLMYIDDKMDDEDPFAEEHHSYTDKCALMLARLVKWNVTMGSDELVPPNRNPNSAGDAKGTRVMERTEGKPLLDYRSQSDVFNWVRHKVSHGDPRTAMLLLLGMLDFARDMKNEEADENDSADYLDSGETRLMSIRTAYDRYGKDGLLRLVAAVCGDSGNAIKTLWKTINSRTPVDEDALPAIGNAVVKLSELSGIRFMVNVDPDSIPQEQIGY